MTRPDFNTLPMLPGHPHLRLVAGSWIDREEYDVCQWHVVRTYETDDGGTGAYWKATLDGLRRYGALKAQRKAERREQWADREAEDEAYRQYIDSLHDAKPQHPGGSA